MRCFQPMLNRIAVCLAHQKRAGVRATGHPPTPAVGRLTRGSALADFEQALFDVRDGARIRSAAPLGSRAVVPAPFGRFSAPACQRKTYQSIFRTHHSAGLRATRRTLDLAAGIESCGCAVHREMTPELDLHSENWGAPR